MLGSKDAAGPGLRERKPVPAAAAAIEARGIAAALAGRAYWGV